jgi:hypothetical protein
VKQILIRPELQELVLALAVRECRVGLEGQRHALRRLIEHREQLGPRAYISADLAEALRGALETLELLNAIIMAPENGLVSVPLKTPKESADGCPDC